MILDIITPRRWSIGALECYERECNCIGCKYKNNYESNYSCQMYKSVEYLKIEYGIPPENIVKKALNNKDTFSDFSALNNDVTIKCLDTGEIFKSFDELSKHLKVKKKILVTDFKKPVMTFMGKVYTREYQPKQKTKKHFQNKTKISNLIICVETGEEFLSQKELAERLQLSKATISKYVNSKQLLKGRHYLIKEKNHKILEKRKD